jgi:UDP-2,3-diacylglucosamine hydrolase
VLRTTLGGRTALVAHGDGLGKGDIKYRILKSVLRSRAAVWGFRALHPELGLKIADSVSATPEKALDDRSSKDRAAFLQSWAKDQFAADGEIELIMCGHAHMPSIVEMGPERYYVNSGDWVRNRTYVTVLNGAPPQLLTWRNPASV